MRLAQGCLSLAGLAFLSFGINGSQSVVDAYAESGPAASRIVTVYQVQIGNFNLGNFRLTTALRGEAYDIRGEGRFAILDGLVYEWRGSTASTGRVTDAGPEPASYALNFSNGGKKNGQLRMLFGGGSVTEVSVYPNRKPSPRTIPVTKEQLEGVLDPMSGAFLTARSVNPKGDPKVCHQTLPVFDGEQRFDLVLKPKKTVQVQRQTPGGYAGPAVICHVRFIPISGYQPDNPGIKLMRQSNEIEVWLIPVAGTSMYVPYRIVLPTPIGYGVANITSIQVAGARRASAD